MNEIARIASTPPIMTWRRLPASSSTVSGPAASRRTGAAGSSVPNSITACDGAEPMASPPLVPALLQNPVCRRVDQHDAVHIDPEVERLAGPRHVMGLEFGDHRRPGNAHRGV